MTPEIILGFLAGYFIILLTISWWTNQKSTSETFFHGDHKSPWIIVAFGLIGTSMSGVTMVSVTGKVITNHFHYLQSVLGYVLGYVMIAYLLLTLYYKLKLTSIYHYLGLRFGFKSQLTGSFYFILSRTLGAAARLYLAVLVMDSLVFSAWGIPFWATVLIIIFMIFIYTAQGGIKTIVWTDTLQSALLLLSVGLNIYALLQLLDYSFPEALKYATNNQFTHIINSPGGLVKDLISGMLICLTMTGLDQGMMQRSLSCRSLFDAQKNILSFTGAVVIVNLLFLIIGALIGLFLMQHPMSYSTTDTLFPSIANLYFPPFIGGLFILGMIAATFSSADDAMTALTTTISLDIFGLKMKDRKDVYRRNIIHFSVGILLFFIIMVFLRNSGQAIIDIVLGAGAITYGPLLGLFAFGMFTSKKIEDSFIPWIAIASPLLVMSFCIYAGHLKAPEIPFTTASNIWKLLFKSVGTEIIAYIGAMTFLLMYIFSSGELDRTKMRTEEGGHLNLE